MSLKTVNVSEDTKKFLDAIADVMEYTQDRVVQMALAKYCPIPGWNKMSLDELKMAIAKQQIRRLKFMQDIALCDEHSLELSDLGVILQKLMVSAIMISIAQLSTK